MRIKESDGWLGEYQVTITQKNGKTETQSIKNRITNAGLNLIRDALNGDVNDLEIKYIALGSSAKAINDNDTTLDNEQFRKNFIQKTKTGVGRLQSTALIQDNEAVFHIRELGIFAGDATDSVNSGVMISRILYDRNKTELESIQFVRTDTISRG